MNSVLLSLITVLGWGTWLAPSHRVAFANQSVRTLYVVLTNLAIASCVVFWKGGVSQLSPASFALVLTGGVIWTVGGLCAFTGTSKLGMAKAFGIWSPLNIVVSLIFGIVLFGEFSSAKASTLWMLAFAVLVIISGVILIVFAKGEAANTQGRRDLLTGLFSAACAGLLWGSYFIPVKYSGASPWAGAFPMALGMAIGGVALALPSRSNWLLANTGDYARACATGVLWSIGNYGVLLLVDAIGAGKGFTIAQISVVVSALIGIYGFREPSPKTTAARLTLLGCVLATIGGVLLGSLK